MDIVLLLHSIVRFLILLVAVVGVGKTLFNVLQPTAVSQMDQGLASGFLGLFDLQVLLGLLIILLGGLTQAIHPVVMFLALVIAHALSSMAKPREGMARQWVRLAMYVVPLLIILLGLASIGHLPA